MESINFKSSGGDMNLTMRVLQTFTLHTHSNGCIFVTDDKQNDKLKGAGFPTAQKAIDWFKKIDQSRIKLY